MPTQSTIWRQLQDLRSRVEKIEEQILPNVETKEAE